MKKILIILFILFYNVSLSQIINIEKMKFDNDTSNFIIYFSTNFNKKITKYDETTFNGSLNFLYKLNKHTFINIINSNVYLLDDDVDQYGYFEHFRYNYNINNTLIPELYLQYKYDNLLDINKSYLIGNGIRIKTINKDNIKIFIGISIMYHYKELINNIKSETFRNSNYLTLCYKLTNNIKFISTTYYQPNIIDIKDYRMSNDNSFFFSINKYLELAIFYNSYKTTNPTPNIRSYIYNTGLKIVIKYNN